MTEMIDPEMNKTNESSEATEPVLHCRYMVQMFMRHATTDSSIHHLAYSMKGQLYSIRYHVNVACQMRSLSDDDSRGESDSPPSHYSASPLSCTSDTPEGICSS